MLSAGLRLVSAGRIGLAAAVAGDDDAAGGNPRPARRPAPGGAPADLIRFDPDEPYVLDPATLHSRCRNTPFDTARLEGRVKLTLVAGRVAHHE